MEKEKIINKCKELLEAYKSGELGQTKMPEESHPDFGTISPEERLSYFTLPMALNYQRDSYKMWEAALATFNDKNTAWAFNAAKSATATKEELQKSLLKHRLAMQPNKHTETWQTICKTVDTEFGGLKI